VERVATSLDDLAAGRAESHTLTAHEVLNARFQATKFRDGYDQDQVDDFLDAAILALKAGHGAVEATSVPPLDAAGVASQAGAGATRVRAARAELVPVRRAAGYAVAEVDAVLEQLARELDRRARGEVPRTAAHDVRTTRLRATWWRPGYPQPAVDELLEQVATALGG
jgi:DivIVA domain-containing protein